VLAAVDAQSAYTVAASMGENATAVKRQLAAAQAAMTEAEKCAGEMRVTEALALWTAKALITARTAMAAALEVGDEVRRAVRGTPTPTRTPTATTTAAVVAVTATLAAMNVADAAGVAMGSAVEGVAADVTVRTSLDAVVGTVVTAATAVMAASARARDVAELAIGKKDEAPEAAAATAMVAKAIATAAVAMATALVAAVTAAKVLATASSAVESAKGVEAAARSAQCEAVRAANKAAEAVLKASRLRAWKAADASSGSSCRAPTTRPPEADAADRKLVGAVTSMMEFKSCVARVARWGIPRSRDLYVPVCACVCLG
jgi:hypothetical protein